MYFHKSLSACSLCSIAVNHLPVQGQRWKAGMPVLIKIATPVLVVVLIAVLVSCQVYFVTKQWQKAHDLFVKISKRPQENFALSRLVVFKLLLCKMQLGDAEEATILAGKYDITDNSPFYYYANAALAFGNGEAQTARNLLAQASARFPDNEILAPWQDTLAEYGYVQGDHAQSIQE